MKEQDGIGDCNDFVFGKLNIISERYVLKKQSQLYSYTRLFAVRSMSLRPLRGPEKFRDSGRGTDTTGKWSVLRHIAQALRSHPVSNKAY